jgi:hypothetical protein
METRETGQTHLPKTGPAWRNLKAAPEPAQGVAHHPIQDSAVRLAAVPDAGNLDSGLVFGIKEHTLVATVEPEAGERRLELFHVAGAAGQVTVYATENLHRGPAFDGAQIGASFR